MPVADIRTVWQPKSQTPAAAKARGPIAIVDIGSNSVRLVVYEIPDPGRGHLAERKIHLRHRPRHGRTGRLHAEGCTAALEALSRFRMIADGLNVEHRDAVATAAARDASNGAEFIRRAESAWGRPIRILAGEDEARIAAEGVVAGIPDADGLAADLGGGSLDMVSVKGGQTGAAYTMPFGPLRLMDQSKGDPDRARDIVDKGLQEHSRPVGAGALCGRWHLAQFRAGRHGGAELSAPCLAALRHPARPRASALPAAGGTFQRQRAQDQGRLQAPCRKPAVWRRGAGAAARSGQHQGCGDLRLWPARRAVVCPASRGRTCKDPLVEFARAANARTARVPVHAHEMLGWTAPLFEGEDAEDVREREASALFSDIGWRRHPDDRAAGAFNQVLTAPFAGAGHRARAVIAASVFHRYSGDEDFPQHMALQGLLDKDDEKRALVLGLAWRFAFSLSASAAGELANYRLRMTPSKVILEVPARREAIAGEPVQRRLGELADALGRKGEILVG